MTKTGNPWSLLRPLLAGGLLMLSPLAALGEMTTLTGKINGHDCAERGEACPVDKQDPHVALESGFVLQRADGEYFFLTNVPRDVKVRHVLETATVTGDLNRRYNTVKVDTLEIGDEVIWSQELQRKEAQRAYWPGALTDK